MLQHEIAPFAQAHRNAIDEIIEFIQPPHVLAVEVTFTRDQMVDIVKKLRETKRGFDRFEACSEDEWKQKLRYAETARNCRVNHRDQQS